MKKHGASEEPPRPLTHHRRTQRFLVVFPPFFLPPMP